MDSTLKNLLDRSNSIHAGRGNLLTLWQSIAENFYPHRANFTQVRSLGSELNEYLMSSYPLMVHRDLSDSFSTMLRKRDSNWFRMGVVDYEDKDLNHEARVWLEHAVKIMRSNMYQKDTQFVRTTKETDRDFAAFGNGVIEQIPNRDYTNLIYRNHHLKDCAWLEGMDGRLTEMHRNEDMAASDMVRFFGSDMVHKKVNEQVNNKRKDSQKKFKLRHMMLPTDQYHDEKYKNFEHVSIWVDVDNQHIMEEIGSKRFRYTVPRWTTASGSPYGYSPATVTAMPDARLLQQMTRVILEAGEKAVYPPMVATEEAVRSNIDLVAGGVTWVDFKYDEKMGDPLRPIKQNFSGLPLSLEMREQIERMISEAFYISKLNLPPPERGMTAYEVARRVEEYIRQAAPLFEPLEQDYNAILCEDSFEMYYDMGAFAVLGDIPKALEGKDVEFRFESPLHDSMEEGKVNKLVQSGELLAQAAQMDPSVFSMMDITTALKDSLHGIKVPETWFNDEDEVARKQAEFHQKQEMQEGLALAAAAGDAGQKLGGAAEGLGESGG